jgi:hypothetical protein
MSSIFLKKIAPPTPSLPAGIGVMTVILIKDHDFLKNHLKIGKTKTGWGTIFLKKLWNMEGKRGRERKGGERFLKKSRGKKWNGDGDGERGDF